MAQHCSLCGAAVSNCRERRNLFSDQSSHVVQTAVQLLRSCTVDGIEITESEAETILKQSSYVCKRPCFVKLERILKLENELEQLKEDMKTSMKELHRADLSLTTTACSAVASVRPPPAKRQLFAREDISASPCVTLTVGYHQKQAKNVIIKGTLMKKLARSVATGAVRTIAQRSLAIPSLRQALGRQMGLLLRKELKGLCADSFPSVFRNTSKEALESFSLDAVMEELSSRAPIATSILTESCSTSKSSEQKKQAVFISMAVLLKFRNSKMNLFASILSMLLQAGHAARQVYRRMQRTTFSLSPRASLYLLDSLGEGYDSLVLSWCSSILPSLQARVAVEVAKYREFPTSVVDLSLSLTSASLFDEYGESCDVIYSLEESRMSCNDSLYFAIGSTNIPLLTSTPQRALESDPMEISTSPLSSVYSSLNFSSFSHNSTFPTTTHSAPSPVPIEESITVVPTDEFLAVTNQRSTVHASPFLPDFSPSTEPSNWHGFKIVGDNIDKTVRRRHQTMDRTTQSLHYFNAFAVRDRVDFSGKSEERPDFSLEEMSPELLLPSSDDLQNLLANFEILVGRILSKHLPVLENLASAAESHIKHKYYTEMSSKSEIVPLGIQLKSENDMEEMVSILEEFHRYVPVVRVEEMIDVPGEAEPKKIFVDHFHHILLGGDQMTCARVRGAQHIRETGRTGSIRLEGVIPVIEDWHAKVCFMQVIWRRLYGRNSTRDGGTLLQIRNLINRSSVPKNPKDNVNAAEDFLDVVLIGHVVAAGMQVLGMKEMNDKPNISTSHLSKIEKKETLKKIAHKVVDKFVNLSILLVDQQEEENCGTELRKSKRGKRKRKTRAKKTKKADEKMETNQESVDGVLEYAKEFISLALLKAEFDDAVKEGDGDRVLRCWKFFLLLFKASQRKNYSIEALNLLAQCKFLLPPRLAEQVLWSRFINTHGKPGCNIASDLHMEHLNRACKTAIASLGANVTPQAVTRVGKCIGPLLTICDRFDNEFNLHHLSSETSMPSITKDLSAIVKQLTQQSDVFNFTEGRYHQSFKGLNGSLISKVNKKDLVKWMNTKLTNCVL